MEQMHIDPSALIEISRFPQLSGEVFVDGAVKSWKKKQVQLVAKTELPIAVPKLVETQSVPVEVQPVPVEVRPIPVKVQPAPVEVQPAPMEVQPALIEAQQHPLALPAIEKYDQTPVAVPVVSETTPEIVSDVAPVVPKMVQEVVSATVPDVRSNTQKKRSFFRPALRFAGNMMVGGSLFVLIFLFAPFIALELRSTVQKITQPFFPIASSLSGLSEKLPTMQANLPSESMPPLPKTPDADKQFRIVIPSIGVDTNVVANVDAGNKTEYEEALKQGVAHARGTGLPGENTAQNRTIFLFSHSTNGSWNITRYNALFYSLKDAKAGDLIQIWFWGEEYWYKVQETKVVAADDTSFLEAQTEKEQLILQTCWPPGTSWKRLIVIAQRVEKPDQAQLQTQTKSVGQP